MLYFRLFCIRRETTLNCHFRFCIYNLLLNLSVTGNLIGKKIMHWVYREISGAGDILLTVLNIGTLIPILNSQVPVLPSPLQTLHFLLLVEQRLRRRYSAPVTQVTKPLARCTFRHWPFNLLTPEMPQLAGRLKPAFLHQLLQSPVVALGSGLLAPAIVPFAVREVLETLGNT